MAAAKYSKLERQRMKAIREAAARTLGAVCWWCGKRPHDEKWAADHVFSLLRQRSPLVAACAKCNRSRNQKLPNSTRMERLFHSPQVVRSCPAADLRLLAETASAEMFGSEIWIDLLIAAVDGKKLVYHPRGSSFAAEQNTRLNDYIARRA